MAIIPVSRFPGQIAPISDNYPSGSAINVTAPSAGDGTPLVESWMNDLWGFAYRMLRETGAIPNDVVDTTKISQFFDALVQIAQAGQRKSYVENDVGSPNSKIIAKAGVEWDSTNQIPIALLADLKKDITAPWVAGDDAGGYASAAPLAADSWYHVFLIKSTENQAPGIVDIAVDANITAAQALAVSGYTTYERIGSILTDGSSFIKKFVTTISPSTKIKKTMWLDTQASGISNPSVTFGTLHAIETPPDLNVSAIIRSSLGLHLPGTILGGGYARAKLFSPLRNNPVSIAGDNEWTVIIGFNFGSGSSAQSPVNAVVHEVVTNTASQIKYAYQEDAGINTREYGLFIDTLGWVE